MNLQAKRSVFRSRKSRQRTKGIQSDLVTSYLGHMLATKSRKKADKESRAAARERARPQRRGGARITSSRGESVNIATAIMFGAWARMLAARKSPSNDGAQK